MRSSHFGSGGGGDKFWIALYSIELNRGVIVFFLGGDDGDYNDRDDYDNGDDYGDNNDGDNGKDNDNGGKYSLIISLLI